ncbi:MAG: SDR family oxidoreductase [Bacteroidales bacterium]|jgi:short-subunit dehydrogenase|nr:SDR family oxidoreductase [Bacteroidales bacterium]
MRRSVKDKVVVITGASSGIGLSCARAFFNRGARVVLAARSDEKIQTLKKELNDKGEKRVIAVKTDVSVESDCKNLIAAAVETFGGVDILLNNAGVSMRANFADLDLNVIRRLMDVNFWGAVYCTKYAYPYIIASKGSIVGISSVAAVHGMPGRTGYSASKYALEGFLETIRVETLKKGVHVMLVVPGFVSTNIRKAALTADGSVQEESPRDESKMMPPEELARRIIRGIERGKRNITTSWEGRYTPFVNFFFPELVDNLYYNNMKKETNSPLD